MTLVPFAFVPSETVVHPVKLGVVIVVLVFNDTLQKATSPTAGVYAELTTVAVVAEVLLFTFHGPAAAVIVAMSYPHIKSPHPHVRCERGYSRQSIS